MQIKEFIKVTSTKLTDRSEAHQDELRAGARKIKLTPVPISEYITKYRILRKDMAKAGCVEILSETDSEQTTVQ